MLNEQRQAFGRIVRLGQARQPHCWLLNVGPGGYDDRVTQLHYQSLESGAPLVPIPTEIVHQVPFEWTPEEQERLAAVVKTLHEQTLTDLRGVGWRVCCKMTLSYLFPVRDIVYLDYVIMRGNDTAFFRLPVN